MLLRASLFLFILLSFNLVRADESEDILNSQTPKLGSSRLVFESSHKRRTQVSQKEEPSPARGVRSRAKSIIDTKSREHFQRIEEATD